MKNMQLIREIAELQGVTPSEQDLKDIYTKTSNQYIENILNKTVNKEEIKDEGKK